MPPADGLREPRVPRRLLRPLQEVRHGHQGAGQALGTGGDQCGRRAQVRQRRNYTGSESEYLDPDLVAGYRFLVYCTVGTGNVDC